MTEPQNHGSEPLRHALPSGLIHDLRTPLNQINGYSEMLIEQAQEQGQDDLLPDLQCIHAAGKQLLAIINDNFHSVCVSRAPAVPEPREDTAPIRKSPGAEASPQNQEAGELASGVGQGLVLVVDDVEANRDVLSRRLERQGYAVATAEDGRQALDRLSTDAFDLVLLDIMMPEMDGYEVLQRLKADEALRHIPVIMISALSELESVVRCIEMGAEDYLPKPFNPTLLKARIGACLEKKRARDRERHLFTQLEARNTEMARWRKAREADLAIARTTQQGIVSAKLPKINGWAVEAVYTPLIQVGGDVYGWRQLDHGVWLFWLADASGHGVAAALFTTLVALLFDHASSSARTAHGILARVNAEFYSVLRGRSFMTACCAIIEADGRLTFAGTGHPPLLVRRRDGTVEVLLSRNTVMGIDPSMKINEEATTLASGEVAVLYTDGLYSSNTTQRERFTHQAVSDAFARTPGGTDVLPRLITDLAQQFEGHGFGDDVAAIALLRG